MAVIKPMVRSNICINAHPIGCARDTEHQIEYAIAQKAKRGVKTSKEGGYAPKNVLVLGCSTGYGLSSRITAAFEYGADTIGVSFEKEPTVTKGGTPGWYNNKAFDRAAQKAGLKAKTFNLDNITKGLNDALSKLKEKYELSVELRANPELGKFFESMFDVNMDNLPRTITEYEKSITDALNKAIKERHDNLQLDSLRLTEDDLNVYRTMAKNGELNPMSLADIENACYRDQEETEVILDQAEKGVFHVILHGRRLFLLLKSKGEQNNENGIGLFRRAGL